MEDGGAVAKKDADSWTDERCDAGLSEPMSQAWHEVLAAIKRRNARIRELKQEHENVVAEMCEQFATERDRLEAELAELRGREAPEAAYERGKLDARLKWPDDDEPQYQPPEPGEKQ